MRNRALLGLSALLALGNAAAATELTVYTAFEAVQLPGLKAAFEKANPDIKINWVRDSTGIITAKLLAEKDNPQADVIWGVSASSLLLLKNEQVLKAYAPKGMERLDKRFYDSANPPYWVGLDAYVAALCVNTVELKKHKLPMPKSWKDLTKPVYQGHLRMPNPASSGTGFLDVSAWLQMFGEQKGWQFMDALHANMNSYTHSGSKPCKDAARGETTIGISFAFPGASAKTSGAPIEVVIPSEGIGWDAESAAMVKDTDYEDEVQKLLDFSISDAALAEYNKSFAVLAVPNKAKPVKNYPSSVAQKMIKNDFEWAATNRERILDTWQKRYDSKSEKK